jgi:hypothetical protein
VAEPAGMSAIAPNTAAPTASTAAFSLLVIGLPFTSEVPSPVWNVL